MTHLLHEEDDATFARWGNELGPDDQRSSSFENAAVLIAAIATAMFIAWACLSITLPDGADDWLRDAMSRCVDRGGEPFRYLSAEWLCVEQ